MSKYRSLVNEVRRKRLVREGKIQSSPTTKPEPEVVDVKLVQKVETTEIVVPTKKKNNKKGKEK